MSQWGKSDAASNSVIWAPTSVKLAPNSTNRNNLFGNTTADAFVTNATVGMFGVDTNEVTAERQASQPRPAHAGWVLRTEGSGGRAGRVQQEVLVAMGTVTSDAEDETYQDYVVSITTQPSADSANSAANETATFTVAALTTPTGGTLSYQWQGNSTGSFANLTNGAGISGVTTDTLTLNANTVAARHVRVVVGVTGGNSVTSSAAAYTVTS